MSLFLLGKHVLFDLPGWFQYLFKKACSILVQFSSRFFSRHFVKKLSGETIQ